MEVEQFAKPPPLVTTVENEDLTGMGKESFMPNFELTSLVHLAVYNEVFQER